MTHFVPIWDEVTAGKRGGQLGTFYKHDSTKKNSIQGFLAAGSQNADRLFLYPAIRTAEMSVRRAHISRECSYIVASSERKIEKQE